MLRAKLVVQSVKRFVASEEAELRAVYSSDPDSENYSFSQATPVADFRIVVSKPAAMGQFKPGQEFYLDLTPVGTPVA